MKRGFTLIEVIAVLVLMAVMVGIVGLMVGPIVQRYNLERDGSTLNERAHIAMARIVKELTWADRASVVAGAGTLQWNCAHPDRAGEAMALAWDGAVLLLNGVTLLEGVTAFASTSGTDVNVGFTVEAGNSGSIELDTTVRPQG